jgi:predicted MFS family arabinose efflux permease
MMVTTSKASEQNSQGLRARLRGLPFSTNSLTRTFTAFRHRNFRLYFIGLLISVIGMWAQIVGQEWLVYSITNSPLALGQVTAVMAIPVWILGPWAGVVLDRFSRRHVLLISQTIQMVQAFVLAWLTFTGQIQVWHIMVLSGVRGIANAFDAPARQSFVVDMVGKEDLSNAIALNSTMFSLARFVGPAFGALILATMGTAWAFAFNGITFIAILGSLLLMKMPRVERRVSLQSPIGDLLEGFRFIWEQKVISALMVVALVIALFGANFSTLIAVFAKDILGMGEVGFGMMKAANGLGSVLGALVVTYLSTHSGRGKQLNVLNLLFPATLILFAISTSYPIALITLAIVGVTFIPQLSLCNMLIQSNIPDEIRGRVMSVYTLMIFGATPLGALISGAMAQSIGAPLTIVISAAAVILISLATRIAVPRLRHIE